MTSPCKNIGIDIVEIQRIRSAVEKFNERFLKRIYTQHELSYCKTRTGRYRFHSLAARFAAKEAFYKAVFPILFRPVSWHECEIVNDAHGIPHIHPSQRIVRELQNPELIISLSHCSNYAVAVVLVL